MAKKKSVPKQTAAATIFSPKKIAALVCHIRGERVLLDVDLAELYGSKRVC
ncbi:MAG: hypothetical protein AAGC73_07580 [Verrucomicrobiota bacterium]